MSKLSLPALVFLGAVPGWAAAAAPSPAPFNAPESTVEGWAEARFSQMLSSCIPGSGGAANKGLRLQEVRDGKFRGDPQTISAVPELIRNALKLNAAAPQPLLRFGDVKVTGVFGYVYSTAERTAPTFHTGNFLDIRYDGDRDQIVDPGRDFARYTTDCAATVASALTTNANFSLPIVSAKGFFSGDTDAKRKGRASVVTGRFISPIVKMWTGTGLGDGDNRSGAKFYASILFWSFYNTTQRLSDNWLLYFADGASFYQFLDASMGGSANVEAGSDITVPFLTAKASAAATYTQDATTQIQNLDFVIFKRPNAHDYWAMPPLDLVLASAASYRGVRWARTPGVTVVQPGVSLPFQQDVDYLPAAYCEREAWIATPTGALADGASLDIDRAEMLTVDGKMRTCRFTVLYNPGEFTGEGPVSVPFRFVAANAKVAALAFNAQTPTFQRSLRPALNLMPGGDNGWRFKESDRTVSWSLRFRLNDGGTVTEPRNIDVSNLVVDCGADAAAPYVQFDAAVEGNPPAASASKIIRLTGTMQLEDGAEAPAEGWTERVCRLDGLVGYPGYDLPRRMRPGATIRIPVGSPPA